MSAAAPPSTSGRDLAVVPAALWHRLRVANAWLPWFVLVLMAVFFLMPVYVLVVNGLKDPLSAELSQMWQPPSRWSVGGFREAWSRLSPNLVNSVRLVIPATAISTFLGAVNGYFFAKWRFKGSELLLTLLLFGFFIPYQTVLLPLVRFLQFVGLYGTLPGLILTHVVYGLPITTLIFRNHFLTLPHGLFEAARVDGAGPFRIFWSVLLPLSIPSIVVVAIFQFTNIWNEFLFAVTVVLDPTEQPVTVALNNLSGTFSVDWNVVMAGAVTAALPTALVYIFLGRWFVRGVTAGALKG
ncbi:carbohydrate ABC transporter permease [Candidatus Poriferisodalis sp.]|uniref:carbohydrate ABC transporter permease n=1 Tax=Candidatus Poriferisodalis sp. TaxID=3101277 RepID=UPI003B02B165